MSVKDLIHLNVKFEGKSKDWYHCRCKLCDDYKVRSSFKFEDTIKYNCFNCGASENLYYRDGSRFMTTEFRNLLNQFGIDDIDIDKELAQNFFKDEVTGLVVSKTKDEAKTIEIDLPLGSYQVTEAIESDMWTVVTQMYLDSRGLSLSDHKWYLSTDPQYEGRMIIPYYKNNKIIYWQARAFDDNAKKRYIGASVPTEPILFNYDELDKYTDSPLFVMEGAIDAISINGVGMVGSKLYKARIDAFNKSKRNLIFVIDKKDKQNNGYKLGVDALKYGWKITAVDGAATDVNDSIIKYGKLFTIQSLIQNTKSGFEAAVFLETICKSH